MGWGEEGDGGSLFDRQGHVLVHDGRERGRGRGCRCCWSQDLFEFWEDKGEIFPRFEAVGGVATVVPVPGPAIGLLDDPLSLSLSQPRSSLTVTCSHPLLRSLSHLS